MTLDKELERLLLEFYEPHEAFEWLFAPQPMLDGKSAIAVIAKGDIDAVVRILQQLDDGAYI